MVWWRLSAQSWPAAGLAGARSACCDVPHWGVPLRTPQAIVWAAHLRLSLSGCSLQKIYSNSTHNFWRAESTLGLHQRFRKMFDALASSHLYGSATTSSSYERSEI
jgi:hypothetical protein